MKKRRPCLPRLRACAVLLFSALGTLAAQREALAADPPKREVQNYDGRGEAPTTTGEALLWVPRVVLSPLYLVSEFVLRRPIGALLTWAEFHHVPQTLYDFFAFGPDHKAGFAPTFFLDFGFKPSVGVYIFWDDALIEKNDMRVHLSTWGTDWLAGSFTDRYHLNKLDLAAVHISGVRRPDYTFFGIGPRTLQSDISRYRMDLVDGGGTLDVRLWRASSIHTAVGVRSVHFGAGYGYGDPSTPDQVAAGVFAPPDGFSDGYTAQYNHVLAALDTRRPRPAPGSGLRLEFDGEQGSDIRTSHGAGWLRYGGTVAGYYDLNDHSRVVSLSVSTLFADPLGKEPVPFTELVSLGGSSLMRGYYPGRLIDRSAAVATVHYRWPIWIWLDGSIQASVGNVFGEHLRDFKPDLLRYSGAIGIESVGSPDNSLEILVGLGSETFEHGGQVTSARLLFGTNRGF